MTLFICVQRTVFFGIGGVFFVVGLLITCLWPFIFNNVIRTQFSLTENSRTEQMWSETPIPMYLDIYLFNWTNYERTLKYGEKPILMEVGPYVFSEHRSKVDVKWSAGDETVIYHNRHRWDYHPELSNGSLSDNITNLNVVLMTVGRLCLKLSTFQRKLANTFLKIEENFVITKTVDEWLFTGFDDPVLKIMNTLHSTFPKVFPPSLDKFGWFYKRNMSATADGLLEMYTGVDDVSRLGDVARWNNRTRLNSYSGECSVMRGSLGELWAPPEHDRITLFASDICSSLELSHSEDVSLHNLTGRTFAGDWRVFDNGTRYAANGCYCVPNGGDSACALSGVRDASGCRNGAPVFISFPHFYLADPTYVSAVDGLWPNASEHSFRITLEKYSGIPLLVNARLQINILMEPVKDMDVFKSLPRIYMPMLWFHQHAAISPQLAANLQPLAELGDMGLWLLLALTAAGLLLIAVGLLLRWKQRQPHRRQQEAMSTMDPAPWQT